MVLDSSPRRSGGRIFFSGVNFLCWLLFRYPFHPRVTAVHVKYPGHSAGSACGRLELNMHAPYLCSLCINWRDIMHGCMVYTEPAETAAVSHSTSHVTTTQRMSVHHFGEYSKGATKIDSHSFQIACDKSAWSASARKRRTALYKSDHNQQHLQNETCGRKKDLSLRNCLSQSCWFRPQWKRFRGEDPPKCCTQSWKRFRFQMWQQSRCLRPRITTRVR